MPATDRTSPAYTRIPNPVTSGLLLDWDFSDPTAVVMDSSANVLGITDKSGNGWHGAKTGAGSWVWSASAAASKPGITVANAVGAMRTAAAFSLPGTFSVIIAGRITAGQTNCIYEQGQCLSGTATGSIMFGGTASTIQVRRTVSSSKNLSSGWPDGNSHMLMHACDGTHAGNLLYIDGVSQVLTNHTQTSDPGAATVTDVFSMGGGNTSTTAAGGIYQRALVYNRSISTNEISALRLFLGSEYAF